MGKERNQYVATPEVKTPSLILHGAGGSQDNEIFIEYYYSMSGQLHRENAPAVYRRLGDDPQKWLIAVVRNKISKRKIF